MPIPVKAFGRWTICGFAEATAKMAPCPGGRIAANLSTAIIPRFEIVKVPLWYSSGANEPDLALPTSSFQLADKSVSEVESASFKVGGDEAAFERDRLRHIDVVVVLNRS